MSTIDRSHFSRLTRLRLRWAGLFLLSLCFAVSGWMVINQWWSSEKAYQWLGLTAPMLAYVLIILWQSLKYNHRVGEDELLPDLGIGNLLTVLRGILMAGMAGFLFSARPEGWLAWLPGSLYAIAVLFDFLDGALARITHHATRMGEMLDISLDGIGLLIASILVVQYQQAPVWFILVGLARFLFLTGLWLRRKLKKPVYELKPNHSRRLFAGLEMGLLFVLLWPVFTPPGTMLVASVFSIPFLVGFLMDWFWVSGVRIPVKAVLERWRLIGKDRVALGLRLFVTILMVGWLIWTWHDSQPGQYPMRVIEVMVILMMGLGVLSRLAAVMGLVTLGFQQNIGGLLPVQMVLVVLDAMILYLGGGNFSLVKAEEYLVTHRVGEK